MNGQLSLGGWITRSAIFVHRWLGVVLCLVFLLWFLSGIGMMYWTYPGVAAADRLERMPALDASKIRLSAAEAWAKLEAEPPPITPIRLNSFDGRPAYRFGPELVVYADTGDPQVDITPELMLRVAAAWTGQPADAAQVEAVEKVDQWTFGEGVFRSRPMKYSWPNGEQVYVSQSTGEVVQYTTTGSRLAAYVSAIPHWLYFTPLRSRGIEWSRLVIYSSGIGTLSAILGIAIGLWMYSPSKRYRNAGVATAIPYRGQKRLHTIFGLLFGLAAVTWGFSGMLSMEPFPLPGGGGPPGGGRGGGAVSIPQVLRGRVESEAYAARHPREALEALEATSALPVKELGYTSFASEPFYLATLAGGDTYVVPMAGNPQPSIDPQRIIDVVTKAAGGSLAEIRVLEQYDRYYLDRRRQLTLPVVLAQLNDATNTRYYISPKTGRVVGGYAGGWGNRWLYHGLHSFDFPWLYNYRPLWDIVVITFMLGGSALCVTSLILAWRYSGRTLRRALPGAAARPSEITEDLAVEAR